jgi:nucleoside-diphosphate-sugar epimerase
MKTISISQDGVLVSGSSGFIGAYLCHALEARSGGTPMRLERADVLDRQALVRIAAGAGVSTAIHLAASGRVIAPSSVCPDMFATAIAGTLNVVQAFGPRVVVVASTCAVYGNTDARGARPEVVPPRPVGLYGLAKQSAEMIAAQWARETAASNVVLRIGNVIGPGCGGLIPYLVRHAVAHPDGKVHAQLRGGGRIIRDYVPVSHVARVMAETASHAWPARETRIFNVGTCRGTANSEVAAIVQGIVAEQGYRLIIDYADDPAPGEAWQAVLDSSATTEAFGIEPPREDEVIECISDAVRSHLHQHSTAAQAAGLHH